MRSMLLPESGARPRSGCLLTIITLACTPNLPQGSARGGQASAAGPAAQDAFVQTQPTTYMSRMGVADTEITPAMSRCGPGLAAAQYGMVWGGQTAWAGWGQRPWQMRYLRPPSLETVRHLPLCILCSQPEADADEKRKHARLLCMF